MVAVMNKPLIGRISFGEFSVGQLALFWLFASSQEHEVPLLIVTIKLQYRFEEAPGNGYEVQQS